MTLRAIISYSALLLSFTTVKAQVTDAGPDTSLCVNYYTMQGSPLPAGATGFWALVSGCGTIVNAGSPTTDLNSLCIGTNVFVWYVDDNGTITTDQVAITVYDGSMAVADAGPDTITVVAPQNSAFLSGSPTPIYPATCLWTVVVGPSAIADPTDPNTMVAGLAVGDNIFCWTCDNGPCGTTSDTLVIQMMLATGIHPSSVEQPNIFTYLPASRVLHVVDGATVGVLEVFDSGGRCVTSTKAGSRTIRMSEEPEGIYVVRAIVNDRPVVYRFVVTN